MEPLQAEGKPRRRLPGSRTKGRREGRTPRDTIRQRDPARELEDLEALFRALAHPARRHVLLVLHFRGGEMTSREIAARFACTWPTTTRHLRVLEDAGLVRVFRRGRERCYGVDHSRMELVRRWIEWFLEPPLIGPDSDVDPYEI